MNERQRRAFFAMKEKEKQERVNKKIFEGHWNDKVHPMGSSVGTMLKRKDLDPEGYKRQKTRLGIW